MKVTQAVVGVALVAQSNAFFAPSTSAALSRSATRASVSPVAPMRMQADSAGDNVRRAADSVKDAGKNALNKAENAADRVANKVDAKASQVSGGTEIRAADIQGKEVIREAPLTAVHVHEEIEKVDKTQIEQERIKTEVVQKVQPIHDEERRAVDVKTIDHGTEIRHQGKSGLDQGTQAELERRRQELAATTQATKDVTEKHTSARPDVVRKEQTRVIEQVVPVLDKDVYIPKREEHEKKIVNVIHEPPHIVGTQVEQTISKEEFEKKYGTKVDVPPASAAAGAAATSTTVSGRTAASTTSANPLSNAATANTSAAAAAAKGTPGAAQSTYISEHQKQQQFDAAGGSASTSDEPTPYSMSSSNMARDAEEAVEEGEGSGIGSKIKNAIKSIVE